MKCPRCKTPMKELKRSYHKQRKWVCPRCGKSRFQAVKKERKKKTRETE